MHASPSSAVRLVWGEVEAAEVCTSSKQQKARKGAGGRSGACNRETLPVEL